MILINRCGLEYKDKVVFITGGSKGIGEGCARVFVDAGANVVITARGEAAGRALEKELNERGRGKCRFFTCDVTKEEDIVHALDTTIEIFGRLDCAINNAGFHPDHRAIDHFSSEDFIGLFKTNLLSYFLVAKYALPHIRKTKGTLINIGSLAGQLGQEAASIYCATKGGIQSFSKALAIEETVYGVRVNCILPGNILSDSRKRSIEAAADPEALDKFVDSTQPTGRSGTNEEVGQACLFLASDLSSYITGTDIIISGGSEIGYGVKYPLTYLK